MVTVVFLPVMLGLPCWDDGVTLLGWGGRVTLLGCAMTGGWAMGDGGRAWERAWESVGVGRGASAGEDRPGQSAQVVGPDGLPPAPAQASELTYRELSGLLLNRNA